MRGSTPRDHVAAQTTTEIYSVAGQIDDQFIVGEVEGINLEPLAAAVLAYRKFTNRADDVNIIPDNFRLVEDRSVEGWKYYEVFQAGVGYSFIAVRHFKTLFNTSRR